MNEKLLRPEFNKLKVSDKISLMQSLSDHYQIEFKSLYTFSRWRQSCITGVFESAGKEFVFVPGDRVTLGWQGFTTGLEKSDLNELKSVLEEYGFDGSIDDFMRANLTEPHAVDISPMLVERSIEEIGWEAISFSDERLQTEYRDWLEDFWKHMDSGISQYTISNSVRFVKRGVDWQPYLSRKTTYIELKNSLAKQGFSLPTPDEWSYLCGGRCRTLFAWGDSIGKKFCLRHFDTPDEARPYDLELPNFFGIIIGCDPYKSELVDADTFMTCGGDGGEYVCGGMGRLLGYLPCSPHYRPQLRDGNINNDFDYFRHIIQINQ